MNDLVKEFLRGTDNVKDKTLVEPFEAFNLSNTCRPSILGYLLDIDEHEVRKTVERLESNPRSYLRAEEDVVKGSIKFENKDEADNHWCSSTDLKPLNDICTKWCTSCYFPDASSRVNMIINVIRLYETVALHLRDSYKIVFKGGVMIRLLLREFVGDLSRDASVVLTRHLKKHRAMSMSDLDFEIVPANHSLPDSVVYNILNINFAILMWLKNKLIKEITSGHGGMLNLDWDKEEMLGDLKKSLQEEVDGLDDGNLMHGCKIDAVTFEGDPGPKGPYKTKSGSTSASNRTDAYIFSCDDTKCVINAKDWYAFLGLSGVSSGLARPLYASLNTHIGEEETKQRTHHLLGQFHLARIKHGFVVYYTTKQKEKRIDRLSGEILDLSQSAGIRRDELRKMLYDSVKAPYMDYPILGVKEAIIRSYTPLGFLMDHHSMIYNTETEPWKANKIEKRLLRYVMFLTIHVMSHSVRVPMERKHSELRKLVSLTENSDTLRSAKPTLTIPVLKMFASTLKTVMSSVGEGHIRASTSFLRSLHSHLKVVVDACTCEQKWIPYLINEASIWHTDHTVQHSLKK